jgi:hypothetical protein
VNLQSLPNQTLWTRYTEAMDDLCSEPNDLARSRVVNRLEEEIIRRVMEAGGKRVAYRGVQVQL